MRVSRAFQEVGYVNLGAYLEAVADKDTRDVIRKYLPNLNIEGGVDADIEGRANAGSRSRLRTVNSSSNATIPK